MVAKLHNRRGAVLVPDPQFLCPIPLFKDIFCAAGRDNRNLYTLILYGARYGNDIEDVAVLAKQGTGYAF